MKYICLCVCLVVGALFFSYENCAAQIDCEDYAVLVTATVDTLTPAVTLKWDVNPLATGYTILRKTKTDATWEKTLATLSSTTQQYIDNDVTVDSAYEYGVVRSMDTTWVSSDGYIYVSVKLHPAEYRGAVILLVDTTYSDSFSTGLTRLKFDLIGDGWTVIRHDVSPNDSVITIRNIIKTDYFADTANVNTIFVFGHVPVPYSGDIYPDGHTNHIGAWPADGVYADVYGVYTDNAVDDVSASYTANWNVPGDGKYDQSIFANNGTVGLVKLQIGRVDLSNMDSFTLTEPALLKQYLNKDHAFRQKQFTATRQSIISDNFGVFLPPDNEAFASCGWRNFAPLLGSNTIKADTANGYFPSLNPQSCLWAYGCGPGWPNGSDGVGTTGSFNRDTVNTVFTMLFGSWFGDWNMAGDFLRAPLASQPMALSSCWAGRPNWTSHFMGSGETLGFCARWSQNNIGTYYTGFGASMVHIALMGDPTLTMNIVAPASNPQISLSGSNKIVSLSWNHSPDTIRGYYIYRSPILNGKYTRIASLAPNDTLYTDSMPLAGNDYYMVRALKLINSPSGYYFNLSEGVFDSVTNVVSGIEQLTVNSNRLSVYPNPSGGRITIASTKTIDEVKVTNVLGQLIYEAQPKQTYFNLELNDDGLYFVTVTEGNETTTGKVVVSK
jgi:hypothetical protein